MDQSKKSFSLFYNANVINQPQLFIIHTNYVYHIESIYLLG